MYIAVLCLYDITLNLQVIDFAKKQDLVFSLNNLSQIQLHKI